MQSPFFSIPSLLESPWMHGIVITVPKPSLHWERPTGANLPTCPVRATPQSPHSQPSHSTVQCTAHSTPLSYLYNRIHTKTQISDLEVIIDQSEFRSQKWPGLNSVPVWINRFYKSRRVTSSMKQTAFLWFFSLIPEHGDFFCYFYSFE